MSTKRSTIRVSINEFPESITEQEHAPHMTMKSIAKQLERGIGFRQANDPIYTSDLGIRNLQDVHERHNQVMDMFNHLPTDVKKLAQNDFRNFEHVLSNPENYELLKKYDLFVDNSKDSTKLYHLTEDQFQAILDKKTETPDIPIQSPKKTPKNA